MLLRGNAVTNNNALQVIVTFVDIYQHLDNYGNDKYVIFDNECYI